MYISGRNKDGFWKCKKITETEIWAIHSVRKILLTAQKKIKSVVQKDKSCHKFKIQFQFKVTDDSVLFFLFVF